MNFFLKGFNTLGFAIPIISELFIFLDSIIYKVAGLCLKAFFTIEKISADLATSAPQIQYIMDRMMVLAGIFALFRISISLINYLINPDKVKDLQKSATSVVTSIIIALILLVSCKFIFESLGKLEHLVFTNQVIPKIVYGPDNAQESDIYNSEIEATRFVNNVWLLFYTPKNPNQCATTNSGSCAAYNRVKDGLEGSIFSLAGANYTDFDYLPVVSGIVGIVLIYYFLRFAIDLAIRLVQLFVLQVISPIPIIMSIDPSRKKQLTTFATTYLGVYAQVFLRVLTFYIAFIAIDLVGALPDSLSSGAINNMLLNTDATMFVKVILIIGIFQSVSRLPKLIEDALGLKLGIDTSAKGFGGVLKGILGGTAGFIGGGIAGGIAGGAGGALAGAASGMWSGGMGAAASKNAAAGVSAAVAAVGKSHQLGGKIANVGGLMPYMTSGVENFLGAGAKDKAELARFDRLSGDQDKLIAGFNSEIHNQEGIMSTRTRADQLRGGIDTALDQAFAASDPKFSSMQSFVNNNGELSKMQTDFERDYGVNGVKANDSVGRQQALNAITAKKAALEDEYKREKRNFSRIQFDNYNRNLQNANNPNIQPLQVDENFKKALEDYNSYVTDKGMSDRVITSYDGAGTGSINSAKEINDQDKVRIQQVIDDKQAEIEKANQEKERIAGEKKTFENDPKVKARANRDKPRDKPWTN